MKSLEGRVILIGVTGSIAAVETVKLVHELKRRGATVHCVMTEAACKIIHPNALEYATGNHVITQLTGKVEHVAFLGREGAADLLLIAPCTANTIGKVAHGIDDTAVTTCAVTALGAGKPVVFVPAMHESMYSHPAIAENLDRLRELGHIVPPRVEEGKAKLAEVDEIVLVVERLVSEGELRHKRVVITSGPTMEALDPIRVLTTRSSGRTGRELAYEAFRRGANVTIVHNGDVKLINQVCVESAAEMIQAVLAELEKGCDIFINAAALSDYTVDKRNKKIRSGQELTLKLKNVPKLTDIVRAKYPHLFIVCFKAETNSTPEALVQSARSLPADLVVANDVTFRGMGTADNEIYIINSDVERHCGDKAFLAGKIISAIVRRMNGI
ncbi:MAG TPA: bifunctional phosphopantothenoylcysteine decarboxylase/phosphopantothenate--cysteine ligase CoaBC [Candidatus Bathyarchaeia archaeon]|nr:bifunctional phosphopantothenoylcysteine decarboxylase/phosphopantothenate--cysteine ligase CoaBC [Candidatus Bathyarchaeia archaeon]